jgi:hypothetical protein
MITGHVMTPDNTGRLPMPDTYIHWNMTAPNGDPIQGNTTTDDNGFYSIYVQTDHFRNVPAHITIRVERFSGEVLHRYECNEIPCQSRTVELHPLTFDNTADFTDVSTVTVEGTVSIAGTEHTAFETGCPIAQVQVCAVDHFRQTSVGCVYSNAVGRYFLPVANGLTVYLQLTYSNNHTFERVENERVRVPTGRFDGMMSSGQSANYDYFYINAEDDFQPAIDFQDTTRRSLRLEVAGGKCNRTLGRSYIDITYPSCAETWVERVQLDAWFREYELPAQAFDARLFSTEAYTTDIGDMVTNYFTATGERIQALDLRSERQEMRWEYHPEPKFELEIKAAPNTPCSVIVINRDVRTEIRVNVREEYWDSEPICTHVPGNVTLRNQLGEAPTLTADLLTAKLIDEDEAVLLSNCWSECNMEIQHKIGKTNELYDAFVSIQGMSGQPETVAEVEGIKYAKAMEVGVIASVYQTSEVVPVVVLGQKLISDKFTMVSNKA